LDLFCITAILDIKDIKNNECIKYSKDKAVKYTIGDKLFLIKFDFSNGIFGIIKPHSCDDHKTCMTLLSVNFLIIIFVQPFPRFFKTIVLQ